MPQPEPSGIRIASALRLPLHFRVTVTSPTDAQTLTIPADDTWRELDLTPGPYEIDASERTEVVNVDNGLNIIGLPGGPCTMRLDLAPGTTTLLAVTDVYGQACGFSPRQVDAPLPWPPSNAPALPSPASSKLPKTLISKSRAIDLAAEEAPAGASSESISAGTLTDVLAPPPWANLDRYLQPMDLVWVARFADPSTCPGRSPCGETVVFLDYVTGDFLVSVHIPAAP